MGLNLKGASKAQPSGSPSAPASQSAKKSGSGLSFIKTGVEAKALLVEEAAKAEAAKAEQGKLWRFRINGNQCGQDFKITFLDGNLDSDGMLAVPMWKEHSIYLAGEWKNIPCISHEAPCPMCEGGDKASMVAGLTIIDHTPYTIKKGDKAGTVIPLTRKLYVPKRQSLGTLQKFATKQGGLTGCTFEVSRTGEKSAACGDVLMFIEKRPMSVIKKEYGEEIATPADMEDEITYYNKDALTKLGVKTQGKTIGGHVGDTTLESDVDF